MNVMRNAIHACPPQSAHSTVPCTRRATPKAFFIILLGLLMTACQPAPLPTAEVAAKAQPLRLNTACIRALQVGFAQEHDAYLKEYAISGEWQSDTYTAGWILTGFHQALPTEK